MRSTRRARGTTTASRPRPRAARPSDGGGRTPRAAADEPRPARSQQGLCASSRGEASGGSSAAVKSCSLNPPSRSAPSAPFSIRRSARDGRALRPKVDPTRGHPDDEHSVDGRPDGVSHVVARGNLFIGRGPWEHAARIALHPRMPWHGPALDKFPWGFSLSPGCQLGRGLFQLRDGLGDAPDEDHHEAGIRWLRSAEIKSRNPNSGEVARRLWPRRIYKTGPIISNSAVETAKVRRESHVRDPGQYGDMTSPYSGVPSPSVPRDNQFRRISSPNRLPSCRRSTPITSSGALPNWLPSVKEAAAVHLGVGGSAGHASHAVNDFRKMCKFEAYAPTDNVSELTARTNDEGWDSTFEAWLKVSKIGPDDGVLVFSVGGGDVERLVSVNMVRALHSPRSGALASSASSDVTADSRPPWQTHAS